MPSVLVVDDELGYRELLGEHLALRGYEVKTAASGRKAIEFGIRYQPDVLVTDWMLKNHIHGLHVSDVLRMAYPCTQTVVMTGFPSGDLRADAKERGVFGFFEKPFEPDDLERSVHDAIRAEAPAERLSGLAILDLDADGAVVFSNPRAKELLGEVSVGGDVASIADVFPPGGVPDLDAAVDQWITVSPASETDILWQLRAQALRDSRRRMVILRRQGERAYANNALVEMLLGYRVSDGFAWPLEGRILAVEDTAEVRKVFVNLLERSGAGCCAVATPPEALRLLRGDEGLKYVLHDFTIEGFDTAESIKNIQAARPDVRIVGTSGGFHREDFAAMGVDHFIPKPWTVRNIIDAFLGRFGDCGECGLRLPLRRPNPGEQAGSWVCAFCKSSYRAVLDDTCPEDVLRNARRRED